MNNIPPIYQNPTPPKKSETKKVIATIIRVSILGLILIFLYIVSVNIKLKTSYGNKTRVEMHALLLAGSDKDRYDKAREYIESENYQEAYTLLKSLKNYKDAKILLEDFSLVHEKERTIYDGKDPYISGLWIYDDNGDLIRECYMGILTEYFYDENDNLIKEYSFHYDNTNKLIFDENGKLTKDNEGFMSEHHYTYDANGNMTKNENIYNNSFGMKSVSEYSYDSNGNKIKHVEINSEGKKIVHEYGYDSNGNCIKEIFNHPSMEPVIYEYVYDSNGNCIEEFINGESSYKRTFDENGNLLKCYDNKGKVIEEHIYDDEGNCIKSISDIFDLSIREYTYDKNGNIIKKFLFLTGRGLSPNISMTIQVFIY